MKLYGTIESNRAKKGQGGDYLNIEIKDEQENKIFELYARIVQGKYIIDGYAIHQQENGRRSEQYYRYEIEKGNKKKKRNYAN